MTTHTSGPWTASWAENGIAALRDSEGKHFANFRNVRGDEISTVNADLAVVVAAPNMLAAIKYVLVCIDCGVPVDPQIIRDVAKLAEP